MACLSAPIRGENASSLEEEKKPAVISAHKLAPSQERFKHVNKQMLSREYDRYLEELKALAKFDPQLNEELKALNGDEDGLQELARKIPHMRSRIDEVKRQMVEGQRVQQQLALLRGFGIGKDFQVNELGKLHDSVRKISKPSKQENNKEEDISERLKEFDSERRKKFHRAEIRQRLSEKEKLRLMSESERLKEEKRLAEEHDKKEQAKLNHPGSKDQLEELWSETDGFDKGTFTPKSFFKIHDKNGDNYLDILEIEAFFIPEIKKVYGSKELSYEAREEISRMREHLMPEIDLDHDQLVSLEEFLIYTASNDRFNRNEGWNTLDQYDQYSQEDLNRMAEEMKDGKDGEQSSEEYDYLDPFGDYEAYD